MTSKQRCDLAKKYLLELLALEATIKDDEKPGKWVEVPQFSEAGTYDIFGKDRARTIRAILTKIAAALGITDIDRIGLSSAVSDRWANYWEMSDALAIAEQAARRMRFEIGELESAEDFADGVSHARQEVEQAFQTQHYSTPERTITRLARALSIDTNTGRMASKWTRDKEREKAKKAKKAKK